MQKPLPLLMLCLMLMVAIAMPCYASEHINVGVSLALTGEYAVMAQAQMRGFRLWQEHVNERGGILGKKVNILIKDDKGDPKTAVQLYEEFITKNEADLLFAPYSTSITAAVLPLAEKHQYPLLITGAAGDVLWEKGYKYAIGVYTPASKFASGFLEILLRSNIKNVAIINSDDSFSKSLAAHASQGLLRYGLNASLNLSFHSKSADYISIAQKARDSGAEAILLCAHFEEAVSLKLALKRINWKPKAFYASVGAAIPEFGSRLKGDANGVFSTSLWEARAQFPGNEKFYKDYLKRYGTEPAYHAALAYAGGQVLESAITKSKSLDRNKIRDMLFKLDEMTIIGRYGIDNTGKQIRQQTFIIQWQKGVKHIVWPERLSTSKAEIK